MWSADETRLEMSKRFKLEGNEKFATGDYTRSEQLKEKEGLGREGVGRELWQHLSMCKDTSLEQKIKSCSGRAQGVR